MPLILNLTDTDGTEHPDSYWRIGNYSANDRVKTGSFQMHGWHDLSAYLDEKDNIRASPHEFLITDPAVYDEYFGVARLVSDFPFLEVLETYAFASAFFSSASQYSYLEVLSADIGSFDSSRIYVHFSDTVEFDLGGNYLDGVEVLVNSVPVTVSAAAVESLSVLRYDLASPLDANDVITWAYDESIGFLVSAGGVRVSDIPNESVTNQIGSFWDFSNEDNSAHWGLVA